MASLGLVQGLFGFQGVRVYRVDCTVGWRGLGSWVWVTTKLYAVAFGFRWCLLVWGWMPGMSMRVYAVSDLQCNESTVNGHLLAPIKNTKQKS